MTKREFMITLDKALYFLSAAERRDILNDYEEHFRNELAEGKNEYQIASDLGNPVDIAMQYREEAEEEKAERAATPPRPAPARPVRQAPPPAAAPNPNRVDPFASDIPPAEHIFSAPAAPPPRPVETAEKPAKKKKGFWYFVSRTLATAFSMLWLAIAVALVAALVAAGWAVVFAGAVAGLVEGISAFFVYANAGLMIGMFLAGIGLTLVCIALGFAMVKGTIGLFKLAKRIIMKPVQLIKEVFA